MKKLTLLTALVSSALLTGCFSVTGLTNAESDFACSPDLTPNCQSLSATHDKVNQTLGHTTPIVVTTNGAPVDRLAIDSPLVTPKRAPEKILRIWVAPFIDEEGDLHDQHFLFTTVYRARWAPETLAIPKTSVSSRVLTPLKAPIPTANTIRVRTTPLDGDR